jgi:hypothetical protein
MYKYKNEVRRLGVLGEFRVTEIRETDPQQEHSQQMIHTKATTTLSAAVSLLEVSLLCCVVFCASPL